MGVMGRPKKNPPLAGSRQRPVWGQKKGLSAYDALRAKWFRTSAENFSIARACRDRLRVGSIVDPDRATQPAHREASTASSGTSTECVDRSPGTPPQPRSGSK